MAENSREIILDLLLTIEREAVFSNQLIKAVLDKYDYLEGREKAFIKRVAEGTLERQIELDYYLDRISSVPVRKMKPLIRCLMRMSVYQLLYMDSVPDSAVCNEACKLAVKRKFAGLRGFVNGVLRSVARQKDRLPMPDPEKNLPLYLSVKYSMPEWLVNFFLASYEPHAVEKLLEGLLTIHPVSVRFDGKLSEQAARELRRDMERAGAVLQRSPYLPYAYLCRYADNLTTLPGFADGQWTVQDVSCALAIEAADIAPGDFVVDACASPGGKALLAAQKADRVLARDVSEEKLERILENIDRMGVENVETQVWDARITDEALVGRADVLLLDVPCSGLGIIGKKRDIKYHVSEQGMTELNALQREIVKSSVSYLKPGGTLLYSTCTINPAENEEMVAYLTRDLGLEPVSLQGRLPEVLLSRREAVRQCEEPDHFALTEAEADACIQLLPGFMESDGFFIACLKRPLS
ncbi:MAG: 16S rRNA (cytosine(967)-C(5))-methyltransferase RsmB [Acetatifactor sp.]